MYIAFMNMEKTVKQDSGHDEKTSSKLPARWPYFLWERRSCSQSWLMGHFARLLMFHLLYLFYLRSRCCLYNGIWILQVSFMASAKISSNTSHGSSGQVHGTFNLVRNHWSNKFLLLLESKVNLMSKIILGINEIIWKFLNGVHRSYTMVTH
jgi:hypothetical protein